MEASRNIAFIPISGSGTQAASFTFRSLRLLLLLQMILENFNALNKLHHLSINRCLLPVLDTRSVPDKFKTCNHSLLSSQLMVLITRISTWEADETVHGLGKIQ